MSVFTDQITITNTPLTVDGSAVTQPVSALSLPLPTGASTSANQTTGNASLTSIDSKTPALVGGRQPVDGSGVTQPISGSVSITGTVATISGGASSATIARVATSSSAVTILASNVNRKKAIVTTETGTANYVAFGSAASITNYTYLLGSQTVLEVTGWTGSISLIRASGTGNVQVTELV